MLNINTLNRLKIQLEKLDESQDLLLKLLLDDSEQIIKQMTNRTDVSKYETAVRAVAVIMYNKIGREGLSSYGAGGVSVSYEELPISIKGMLPPQLVSIAGRFFESVEAKQQKQ